MVMLPPHLLQRMLSQLGVSDPLLKALQTFHPTGIQKMGELNRI